MVGMYYYALADQNLTLVKPARQKSDGRSANVERRTANRVAAHGF